MDIQKERILRDIEDGRIILTGSLPLSHSQAKLVLDDMWESGESSLVCAFKLGFLWFAKNKDVS